MATKRIIKFTANCERNLEEIERYFDKVEAPRTFDDLLDELLETVLPNLAQFPEMGRSFLRQPVRSVEVSNAVTVFREKLAALTPDTDAIREYVLRHYLMLYAVIEGTIYLLAIWHQRQLSFDFEGHWDNKTIPP